MFLQWRLAHGFGALSCHRAWVIKQLLLRHGLTMPKKLRPTFLLVFLFLGTDWPRKCNLKGGNILCFSLGSLMQSVGPSPTGRRVLHNAAFHLWTWPASMRRRCLRDIFLDYLCLSQSFAPDSRRGDHLKFERRMLCGCFLFCYSKQITRGERLASWRIYLLFFGQKVICFGNDFTFVSFDKCIWSFDDLLLRSWTNKRLFGLSTSYLRFFFGKQKVLGPKAV